MIAHILLEWGINCHAYRFGGHDEYLCLPPDWNTTENHIMYGTQDGTDADAAILHTWTAVDGPLHALGHMKVLYKLGYIKTAIIDVVDLRPGLHRVVFVHLRPMLAGPTTTSRQPTDWPLPQTLGRHDHLPFDPATWQPDCNECCIELGISIEELTDVFAAGSFPLCTTFEGLDLPATTQQFAEELQPNPGLHMSYFDRLVVYAEGSSLSALRHQPPLLLAERGQADTWAFIVIGEVQVSDGTFQRYLVGWQAQPVLYDDQCGAYIGTSHAGSDAAEMEALFWSMVWRISINDSVSTTFCTDPQLPQAQANGEVGSAQPSESFRLLRGAAQTLAAILPDDKLRIQHVQGHSNDPLNDFVDFAAKREREKSYYLPRPRFSMCNLRKFLPYMWMLFHKRAGLPSLCRNGFHAPPPKSLSSHSRKTVAICCNGNNSWFALALPQPMSSRCIEVTLVMQAKCSTCVHNSSSSD
jgi:ribonuclease HI